MAFQFQREHIPESPGVYLMKNAAGEVLYVGKAANLRRRVSSYFERPTDARIQKMVSEVRAIETRETDTALEALILEARLIKEIAPPYNIKDKDNKSFLFVEITKEKFPRVLLVRGTHARGGVRFGPFPSASSIRSALDILRRIFPWSVHNAFRLPKGNTNRMPASRACFDYEIGLCPGVCIGAIGVREYARTIRNLKLFFEGKKERIIRSLEHDMARAAKRLDFERAATLRRQLFSLRHIADVALISDGVIRDTHHAMRIEGYDISNISGTSAVGSMVVFENGAPATSEYKKFKIRTIAGSNDVGMLREVLHRRFSRVRSAAGWAFPDCILIDGGVPQVRAVQAVLEECGVRIPVVGIAKGPERKRNDIIGTIPAGVTKETLIRVRDEAHRFAITYHKKLRGKRFFE